jgi:lysophospholipase L1-like esterase
VFHKAARLADSEGGRDVSSTSGKASSRLLALQLGVLLGFGTLLVSSCAANENAENAPEGTAAVTNTSGSSWNYVALGDSLAVGLYASRSYVDRYADYINADTGVRVSLSNHGQSGETSSQLLNALRGDSSLRQSLGAADVITFNIGINDFGHAVEAYEDGTCGGADNQDCLRMALEMFEANWDAIIAELLSLRSTRNTIIRTVGLGHTPHIDNALEPYLDEVNEHIATTSTTYHIPYVQPYLDTSDLNPDGIHPNDKGYEVIAAQLRGLGYSPLK